MSMICFALFAQTDQIFVHEATVANSAAGYITTIDHPDLNGNPNANIFVSHNYNPGGAGGVLNTNQTGTWYDGTNWTIFNEGFQNIAGTSYNVFISEGSPVIQVTADGSNYSEVINNGTINNDPGAVLMMSKYWNPFGVYNTQNYGFWYDDGDGRWNLYAEDLDPQPINAAYKVLLSPGTGGSEAFVHTATPANISSNWTQIDHPALNGNPDATLVVMHNWGTAGDAANIVLDKVIGVWYTGTHWAIYIEDQSAMTANLEFNVYLMNPTLGTEDNAILGVTIHPNPATDIVNIQANGEISNITLFNTLGQEVKAIEVNSTTTSINIANLQAGIYLATIESEVGTETRRIIKK